MKNRMLTLIARAFLLYQIVMTVKKLTRLINRYAEKRMGIERNYGPPRTYYRR